MGGSIHPELDHESSAAATHPAPQAIQIGSAIRWLAITLGTPQGFGQAFHHRMLRFMFAMACSQNAS